MGLVKSVKGKMIRIVDVSGGAGSALAMIRVIERFGHENLVCRFADTRNESPDLYAFLDELERYCNQHIIRLDQGKSVWDVFESESMWTNPQTGGCIASHRLKKVPLRLHAEQNTTSDASVIYVGFGCDEDDRMKRLEKAGEPWKFDFPLTWKPRLGRCDIVDELRRRGLHPPDAYDRGYAHANCKQACVLAGIGQWQKLLIDDPDEYYSCERREQAIMANQAEMGRKVCTILRDRRGGETQNLSLRQLREETESGVRKPGLSMLAESCSCVGFLWDVERQIDD